MSNKLVVVGGGGFAREFLSMLLEVDATRSRWNSIVMVCPEPPSGHAFGRLKVDWLSSDEDPVLKAGDAFCVAISHPETRRRLAKQYGSRGLLAATVVHPGALLGSGVRLGEGTIVSAFAVVTTDVVIGTHVQVDRLATIGHDCFIEDFVTLHPAAVLSGSVTVRSGAELGTNSCVLQGITVGEGSRVGAGAVVDRDVPPYTTVVGVPARPVRSRNDTTGDPA